ncbi:GtrA family protein [Longispora albida]|uniref:GtrA family protein n=1 Tax=Longispora albida TaxID=203523 RepID=UPI000371A7B4|nr:GtrA family protein [Longispora albida]
MRLLNLIPERWHALAQELIKFGTVGLFNTFVNFAVFFLALHTIFPNGELKANVVAAVVATTIAYLLNRFWTYRNRPMGSMRREYMLFFFFNAVGMAIDLGVLALVKYGFGVTTTLAIGGAKLVGLVLGTAFRFWSYRTLVFRKDAEEKPADLAEVTS